MTGYKKSLRSALTIAFEGINLRWCYFNYWKTLNNKCKSYRLFHKKLRKKTLIIAFILKIYPYIPSKNRDKYINNLNEYI